jgi:hypothetical protein
MRPRKKTLFVPLWPMNDSASRVTVSLRAGFEWFLLVFATHLPMSLRPLTVWVKKSLTVACSLSVKEKVVPTGGFFLRRPPSRHLRPG